MSLTMFAEGKDFAASTLRWWDRKLSHEAKRVAMAQVIRTRGDERVGDPAATEGGGAAAVTVEIHGTQISVRRGFDAELLRQVVSALGVKR